MRLSRDMAKHRPPVPTLLRWSKYTQVSEVQDPLGLSLRGSARLASRLLYCITSVTPRARYFSFLPWCILDFQKREKDQPHARGLREAIILREQAFTLGCLTHHDGEPCAGGRLVGTRGAQKWCCADATEVDFRKCKPFAKIPALSQYLNSLVNLGLFVTDDERPEADDEEEVEEFTFDATELSELGRDLANRYDSVVGSLACLKHLSEPDRTCKRTGLAEFGERGGLCELASQTDGDRPLLRDIFFARTGRRDKSHRVRRQSLLLILELSHQLGVSGWELNEPEFAGAAYFERVQNAEEGIDITISPALADIATRWRMFYFHYYMSVALEGLFVWLIAHLTECGLAGADIDTLPALLSQTATTATVAKALGVKLSAPFGRMRPAELYGAVGVVAGNLDAATGSALDRAVTTMTALAEDRLEAVIRSNTHLNTPAGLAVPMVLLATTLGRYARWERTDYGQWLASAAGDPYLDLIPPVLVAGLTVRFGEWWQCPWEELTAFVLSRFVIRQHTAMSYAKSWTGERCLLQVDGEKVFATGAYERVGIGNPRFRSAAQVLKDLGLARDDEDGVTHLTADGTRFLNEELAKEALA